MNKTQWFQIEILYNDCWSPFDNHEYNTFEEVKYQFDRFGWVGKGKLRIVLFIREIVLDNRS